MVTKIWDSSSNNEIIVRSTAKRLDRQRVRQNTAYLVYTMPIFIDNVISHYFRFNFPLTTKIIIRTTVIILRLLLE